MNNQKLQALRKMMHPRSIAFWGASANATAMGSVQLAQLLELGFEGTVYPIHPTDREILGLKAYSDIAEVPGPVDLAVLILPTRVVPEILEACGRAGVTQAIVVTAGFSEANNEGKALERRLVEIAHRYGITFLGPNCIGVVNSAWKLNTTFFPYVAPPGFIGMASQSGSFITQMFVHLEKSGMGFSQGFSVGNEAMVDITDCLEYLGDCPNTKVIALYIETIRRGREFFRVAKEVVRKKPIVAYYVGGSQAGGRAALSHTGAMAGNDLLYTGMFKQCGIIRAYTIEELFDYCYLLGSQPLPRGNRVAILTHSGGPGASAADAAERNGLVLSRFSPTTVERLRQVLPHTASVANPVDMTFSRNPQTYTEILPGILLEDKNVDALFMYLLIPYHRVLHTIQGLGVSEKDAQTAAEAYISSQCEAISSLSGKYGKPVAGGSFCTRDEPFVRGLQAQGFAVLPSPERAVKALSALVSYARIREAFTSSNEFDRTSEKD